METVKKGLLDGSKARFLPTEFYMRRGDKAYFRNEYGKIIATKWSNKALSTLKYGQKYQFTIDKLVRSEEDI